MNIVLQLAQEIGIREAQVEAAVRLIDEGNTIPFIARYRKEVTGALNDEQLRTLDERLRYLRNLEDRKGQVLESIEAQGKLTLELKEKIEKASTLVAVEDLYLPYRPKRRTRAGVARDKGLEPLAELIRAQEYSGNLLDAAAAYVHPEAGEGTAPATAEEALQGARDILAEEIADTAEYRAAIRKVSFSHGILHAYLKNEKAAELDPQKVYEAYYDYEEPAAKIPGHRILAINRGEREKVLSVRLEAPDAQILGALERGVITKPNPVTAPVLRETVADAYKRLIAPAIEREIRSQLTETAEDGAIKVFGKNLTQLLLQPPIIGETVLGWDPAFRTGCKLAVSDPTGSILYTTVIYPTAPHNRVAESKRVLKEIISRYHVTLISLGNGTASRESEAVITELIRELKSEGTELKYIIVNEAGASVYSASRLATEEFPEFDVGQRSAASMARRLQDPLSELVKIDPRSVGVGQYQHDMDQKKLSEALDHVVEDCVNKVGVDLNTASVSLLQYVSGINKTLAGNIVSWREENGRFESRKDLLKVAKLGPKAYEQCAGFLRIRGGKEPLDQTSVHPESYAAAVGLLSELGLSKTDIHGGLSDIRSRLMEYGTAKDIVRPGQKGAEKQIYAALSDRLSVGALTLKDIVSELEKPGRDPREEMPKPILKSDVLEMKDLREGMILKGTVRNVIDFGAFVDIGVHQDGLVHISQICDRYIKHPLEAVSVGDVVDVRVLSVDLQKKRIALTMKLYGDKCRSAIANCSRL